MAWRDGAWQVLLPGPAQSLYAVGKRERRAGLHLALQRDTMDSHVVQQGKALSALLQSLDK